MPSKNKVRFPTRCAIAAVLSIAFAVPGAHAAGLGRLTVQSALGQPLRAEIEVTAVSEDEASSLAVALASQAAFRQANLEFNPALASLRFEVGKRADGSYVIRVVSARPVEEPFLDLLVELTSSAGRVQREYTVLLDPPALRQPAEVMPPVSGRAAVTTTPLPAPAAAPPAQPSRPAPAAAAPIPAAAPQGGGTAAAERSYKVKSGDTLGKIAAETKPASANLDQMLVALFQANPEAFVGNNMNRLVAGRTLSIPSASTVEAITASNARTEVAAQSADFARYRSRLAQAATGGTSVAGATPPAASGQGRVGTKVEDRSAPPAGGDQLKIAKADAAASAAAAKKAAEDEAAARKRALKEQEERAAELKKTNEALKKAVELQSKAAAEAQRQAEAAAAAKKKADETAARTRAEEAAALAKKQADEAAALAKRQAEEAAAKKKADEAAEAARKQAEEAAALAKKQAEEAAALAKKQADEAAAKKVAEEKAAAPAPAPAPVPAPPPAKAAPPPVTKAAAPAPEPESGLLDMLTSPYALGGIGAVLLALLFGLNVYRKRKVESSDEFQNSGNAVHANSLFGGVGGQSVDTGATSTFNSSFIPASSQIDSNEVDPVAEADVYIAYGREAQAEDILKEALRLQPDRHAVRVKLMEMYSRRDDKAAFLAAAEELKQRTGGSGEDWIRAMRLGYALDPSNPMFAGAGEMPLGNTDVRPRTVGAGPLSTFGGSAATLGGLGAALAKAVQAAPATLPPAKLPPTRPGTLPKAGRPDTALSPDTMLQASPPSTVSAPTTGFQATLSQAPLAPVPSAPATSLDFSSLDFDLTNPTTRQPEGPRSAKSEPSPAAPAPAPAPTVGGFGSIPDVDLTVPTRAPSPPAPVSAFAAPLPAAAETVRSSVLGDIGTLTDDASTSTSPNTDLATVPLVDFVLTGADGGPSGRRTETQAGSPLAAQMETKLDLARGYIDLGVKDGARELLEEVMREGTREQRQSAVDLMKQVDG